MIMKSSLLLLFVMVCLNLSAEEALPRYRITDLGTLGTDRSEAIAINENGQVLGTLEDRGVRSAFLWDEKSGLKIIELPGSRNIDGHLFLNNNGQFAGCIYSTEEQQAFIWDPQRGYIDVWFLGRGGEIRGFNDKGQVLVNVTEDNYPHAFLCDHGKTIDLTKELNQQIPSNWLAVYAVGINNLGQIAITAAHHLERGSWIRKAFLWKEGVFTAIFPEKAPETNVEVRALDDLGNLIIHVRGENSNEEWFLSASEGYKAKIYCYCDCIRNGKPTRRGGLSGKLKKDIEGTPYYACGIDLRKLLLADGTFFDHENDVRDQNSKGWIVGRMGTIYSTNHAFLGIPE